MRVRFAATIPAIVGAGLLAALCLAAPVMTDVARAMGTEPPADPCQNLTKGSKAWKDCRRKAGLPTEVRPEIDRAATLGYALTKAGRHDEALAVLRPHEAAGDARVLTYIGFAERKLGRVDVSLTYYQRALAVSPDNVATLEYLGEALLQKGEVAAAEATLARIATICGVNCEAYRLLSEALRDRSTRGG